MAEIVLLALALGACIGAEGAPFPVEGIEIQLGRSPEASLEIIPCM